MRTHALKAIRRPFDTKTPNLARRIADSYQIVIRPEGRLYFGRGLELADAMNHGRTPNQCVRNTRAMLTTAVAYLLESGQSPPLPNERR
jgi:hypothetical protein